MRAAKREMSCFSAGLDDHCAHPNSAYDGFVLWNTALSSIMASKSREQRIFFSNVNEPKLTAGQGNPMKLVIFGLTVSSSWGSGHATLWRGLCNALARQGHEVTFFERDVGYYANYRDLVWPDSYTLKLYPSWPEAESLARSEISASDVALVTSYCPDALPACDLVLESQATKVFYDLD